MLGVPASHMRVLHDGFRPQESESTTGRHRKGLNGITDNAAGIWITEVTTAIRELVSLEEMIRRH